MSKSSRPGSVAPPGEPAVDQVFVDGIPSDVPERVAAVARSRLTQAFTDISAATRTADLEIRVGRSPARFAPPASQRGGPGEETVEQRAELYIAEDPKFDFDQLVLPADQADALLSAVTAISLRSRIYGEWGLSAIEPAPSAALNLHGPPGTGKTLAAHAIAARLGMPIIMAGYAELESKFHGEGPKNVKAAFHAAQVQRALLFVDEADSLLSRRLTEVSQGAEQAANSMRSQIVLCLDAFTGVVVFSTNLVANYDRAFESRVRHFHFALPGAGARRAIWRKLLVPALPLAADVDTDKLAEATEGLSGRDIKLAVVGAAERAAVARRNVVAIDDFEVALAQLRTAREQLADPPARQATPEQQAMIKSDLRSRGLIGTDSPEPGEPG